MENTYQTIVQRFDAARSSVLMESYDTDGVGGLNERSLHKILKLTLEPNTELHEVKYLGSVADIKNSEGIFEIQTKAAYKLRGKIERFLKTSPVTLVIPIIEEKYVRYIDKETGEISSRRKSPKSENIYTALNSMCNLADLLFDGAFKVMLIYLRCDEYKYRVKKRGQRKVDIIPDAILRTEELLSPQDAFKYFPKEITGEFYAKDFSQKIKILDVLLVYK